MNLLISYNCIPISDNGAYVISYSEGHPFFDNIFKTIEFLAISEITQLNHYYVTLKRDWEDELIQLLGESSVVAFEL